MDDAFKYIKMKGIESEDEYPYKAVVCIKVLLQKYYITSALSV